MKKKTFTILIVCLCLCGAFAYAYSEIANVRGSDEFRSIGEGKQSAAEELLRYDSYIAKSEEDSVGTVMGINISKVYFKYKFDSCSTSPLNYDNPKEKAWDSIKEEIWEEKFAKDNGIYPTEQEISDYVDTVRKQYESTQEGRVLIKSLCEGLIMTEDEYWEFNKKFEAPLAVTHGKVNAFLETNKIDMPALSEIESTITDQSYYDAL